MTEKLKKVFWDIYYMLSFNAFLNFVVGFRNAGKSYGCKKWCIDDFIKHQRQFIWVRRFDSELDDFKHAFFTDIQHEFPEHFFEYKNYKFYCDDKVMGFAIPLTTSLKKKSSSYPHATKIIFDEFIIDKSTSYYLKNEVEIFMDLVETVVRLREDDSHFKFRAVVLIANAISFINPYFVAFDIKKPTNKKQVVVKDDILLQLYSNESMAQIKKETRLGKIITKLNYDKYMYDNEFIKDSNDFICKPFPRMRYRFTIKSGRELFGVYMVDSEGLMYVHDKHDPDCKIIYTTVLENHTTNTLLLKGAKFKDSLLGRFVEEVKKGNVRYKSVKVKSMVYDTLKRCL